MRKIVLFVFVGLVSLAFAGMLRADCPGGNCPASSCKDGNCGNARPIVRGIQSPVIVIDFLPILPQFRADGPRPQPIRNLIRHIRNR